MARRPGLAWGPLVGLNTGAGDRWERKSWGEGETVELARRPHDEAHASVVLLGGPAEKERNGCVVAAACRERVVAGPSDLSLLGFAALVGSCDVVVTSDSLALHLAVAQSRPVVAFFGPTSANEIDLYGLGEKVVTPLDCRCCYRRRCDARPHCMESIGIDLLYAAVRRSLEQRAAELERAGAERRGQWSRAPRSATANRASPVKQSRGKTRQSGVQPRR